MTTTDVVALTLLHFLWQGVLIHLALATCFALLRPRSANVRYAVATAALACMALTPIATAWRLADLAAVSRSASVAPAAADLRDRASSREVGADAIASRRSATPVPPSDSPPRVLFDALPALVDRLQAVLPWLVALWLCGVTLLAARLLGGWLRLRALVQRSVPTCHAFDAIIEQLRERLRISRAIRILEASRIDAPAIVGWLRPVLLVPASFGSGLTVPQLETILAHELAHIKRHDYIVNLLQSIVETVLFYHPSVWLVSRQIRMEREHCCDDLAVSTAGDVRLYASALLQLESQRRPRLDLAVAASGGYLLGRIRRLLTPGLVEGAEGSRWFAGVFVLAAMVVVAGARFARADAGAAARGAVPNETALPLDKAPRQAAGATMGQDTVILYRGSEPLESRVRWAHATARAERLARYWVGYTVAGDLERAWIHFNRHVPVRAGGGSLLMGRLRMKEPQGLLFSGTALDRLVPTRPARDIALLLGFAVRDGRPQLERVHAASFVFPVVLEGRVLLWLGESSDDASITLARKLVGEAASRDLREDVAGIVAVHTDSDLVRPVLSRWLDESADDGFRAEVVEWLGDHADGGTLGLLARAARADRSPRVRAEAAETMGEIDLPAALDTLIALAQTLTDHNARREAVEAFGQRGEPRALDALRRLIEDDPSVEVKREAVETLGEREGRQIVELLAEIAERHPEVSVQREATESLGHTAPVDDARRVLERLVRTHPEASVRREAIETLGELLSEDSGTTFLESIVQGDHSWDLQVAALDALAHMKGDAGLSVILAAASAHPSRQVRRQAIQLLGESDDPRAKRMLERILTRPKT